MKGKEKKFIFKSPTGDPLPREASQVAMEALASPLTYIIRSLRELLKDEIVVNDAKIEAEIKSILNLLTTTKDLYNASLHKLGNINNEMVDNVTKSMLSEYSGQRLRNTIKSVSNRSTSMSKLSAITLSDEKLKRDSSTSSLPSTPTNEPKMQGQALLRSWNFDVFTYKENDLLPLAVSMLHHLELITRFKIPVQKLMSFLVSVRSSYRNNPYHNFYHAFDVFQTVFCFLSTMNGKKFLTPLDMFALLIASLCHDIDHPGVNNSFHVARLTELAINYNDKSVLENHHCALTFKILKKPENDITEGLTKEEYREFRKIVVNTILSTDMALHFSFLQKFNTRMNSGKPFEKEENDRELVVGLLMKCADVSNIAKPWGYSEVWSARVTEEAYAQGDHEASLNLPVAPFMDRNKSNPARNTANFIDFLARPIYEALVHLLPEASMCMEHVLINRSNWEQRITLTTAEK
eukprot:TRINITY_DN1602_c0_g1_i4.p1 TRINITY_DN1602_c0_g1~~TRINITY_DN1602_c0_g1_i4.p1  ORF type:complete len:464 (-),score=54.11 TRINITY_DN1602_c0_g1_i4:203-1594(-)